MALLQFYGQERNNRDRIKTEARFTDLFNEVREGRSEARISATVIAVAVNKQGIEVRRIADGISALAAQAEEGTRSEQDYDLTIEALERYLYDSQNLSEDEDPVLRQKVWKILNLKNWLKLQLSKGKIT